MRWSAVVWVSAMSCLYCCLSSSGGLKIWASLHVTQLWSDANMLFFLIVLLLLSFQSKGF